LGINLSGERGRDNLPKRYFTLISHAETALRQTSFGHPEKGAGVEE
jgi:hypothetical protein